MKFIFPKNYNFKNKIMGVIDYSTAIFNIIIFVLVYFIVSIFVKNITLKVFFIILFYLPVFLFCIFGSNNESIVMIFFYVIKFLLKPKLYLYK